MDEALMSYPVQGHDYHGYPPHTPRYHMETAGRLIFNTINTELVRQMMRHEGYLCFRKDSVRVTVEGNVSVEDLTEVITRALENAGVDLAAINDNAERGTQ